MGDKLIFEIEVLDPEAKALLDSMARLKLIRLRQAKPSTREFWGIVERLRAKNSGDELSDEEITNEIEAVRASRYARKTQGHR